VAEPSVNCAFYDPEMESGHAWVVHVLAGGLVWQESKPNLSFWHPSPGQTVVHSHMFNEKRSLRRVFRRPDCEATTVQSGVSA